MGPKAKKAANKKKKVSKAERLKLLQEEEERRLKEEEEARLKREKEEQEKLEKQRIEDEKWHKLEEKDLERRNEELEELYLLEGCFTEAEKLKRDRKVLSQWEHYIQCDGTPDPSVAQEINTFLSLWEEETNETFEEVVGKSQLVLSLIEKLKLTLLEMPSCDMGYKQVLQYQGSILRLQEMLQLKFNIATEILLRQASTLADLDSGNMEKVIQDKNVTLYVWANLKKNPRCRNIRFSGTHTGFDIPRILAMSDIALRLLHTRYDHLTPLHPAAAPARPISTDKDIGNMKDPDKGNVKDPDKGNEKEVVHQEEQQDTKQEGELSVDPEGAIQEEEEAPVNTEEHRMSLKKGSEAIKYELEMKLISEAVSAAQLIQVQNALVKPELTQDIEVDLHQYSMLGGVYHLDILELPPQCKAAKGWIIVEILKEGLQKFKYPPDTMEEPDSENIFPPIEVTVEVEEDVIFFEDPIVIRWNAEGQHWRSDGISNIFYNREDRLINFSLDTPSPVALVQDAHINMPYQSWELRPLGVNEALLTVTTVFTEIQIHIKENLCMLAFIKLSDQEHLSHLEEKWMTPVTFIMALKNAGLNFFPTEYSHFYVVTTKKVPVVEVKAYRQMALLSSAFAFAWSKWNVNCNSSKVIFQVKEYPTEDSTNPPWALLMFSGDRAQALKMSEDSQVFSEALKEETEFHSTMYHMMRDSSSKEAIERVRSSDCQFIDAVCHMLLSIRVLSYS